MVYHLIKVSTGGITFGDFMDFLSVISKGSQRDKVITDLSKETKLSADRLGLYLYWHRRVKVWGSSVVATSELCIVYFSILTTIVLQILWTFNFYDVNRDGCISRDEMMKV